jgi:hypothetical protein
MFYPISGLCPYTQMSNLMLNLFELLSSRLTIKLLELQPECALIFALQFFMKETFFLKILLGTL